MANKFPAISQPLPDVKSIHTTVLEMKAAIEILSQQRGKLDISAVTWQDLVNADFFDKAGGHRLVRMLTDGGATLIASGSLSSTSVTIANIPSNYAEIVLRIAGASSGSTETTLVQVSTNNGVSYDSTAANYIGKKISTITVSATSTATLAESGTTHTAAQTDTIQLHISSYNVPELGATAHYRHLDAATEVIGWTRYVGAVGPINALKILGSAGGTFDAGTYALYGVR